MRATTFNIDLHLEASTWIFADSFGAVHRHLASFSHRKASSLLLLSITSPGQLVNRPSWLPNYYPTRSSDDHLGLEL